MPLPLQGVICFMGMDGAGKSTVIKEIDTWLASLNIPTRVLHTHNYNVKSLNKINAFGRENWIRNFHFLFIGWPFVALLDHLFTYKKNFSSTQELILTDRYFYDKYVRFRFWKIALPGVFFLYKWLIPKPRMAFYLDVPPSTAVERKGEYSLSDYETFRREYLTFAHKMKTIYVIDATRSVQEVVTNIKNHINSLLS